MRKVLSISIITILLLSSVLFLGSCDNNDEWEKIRVANTNLYSDNGYIDYASEVYLDTEEYPDTAEMGLFWTYWDAENEEVVQVAADSEEGAALIDPDKPTLINVHGVLIDGYYKQEQYNLNNRIANPEEFDLNTDYVPMNYIWLKEGWNVGNFHYNRFASEQDALGISHPDLIESMIWSNEGKYGVRYRHEDGSYTESMSEYSIAEHFAAEYIRAMNLLPDTMGEQEIRFAGHSMGGEVSTATIFLLTELADSGQLPNTQLPNRYALMDAYFSTNVSDMYMGPKDINIRWSNKQLVSNNTGYTILECLKDLEANGIALEYYTYEQSFLNFGMQPIINEFKTISTYATVNPDWSGNGYNLLTHGHNGVREWYLCSILSPEVDDITNGNDNAEKAPSAIMSTQDIKALKGRSYLLQDGAETVNATDDTMIRTD